MSLLQDAIKKAITPEERAASQVVAVLSEAPQEAAMLDYFSTDPASGYDAAQIALRLFDGGFLGEFSDFLNEKSLSPNIVLANGLTLLQNSLMKFPKDMARLNCLLDLGANPNLFMCKNNENGFGKSGYRAAYHPLNYAFANCPQNTTPEICATLRRYGASVDGLKYRLEVHPELAVPDDATKAQLRQSLIMMPSDPACIKKVRMDVYLSVLQKEMAHVETQLASAGFQVVSYVAPVQNKTIQNIVTAKEDPMALRPGYKAGDKGIFVATIEHKGLSGKSIKMDLFAMPTDLYPLDETGANCRTFKEVAIDIGNRSDGLKLDPKEYEKGLLKALDDGSAFGKWVIPLRQWVDGKDGEGKVVAGLEKNNLRALRGGGDFKGTFMEADRSDDSNFPLWTLSCTEDRFESVCCIRLRDGDDWFSSKNNLRLSCRPFRVELAV